MNLEQVAKKAMDYLDSVGVAAEYEIYTDVKGETSKLVSMPNAKYYDDEYIDVEFDYIYDLLVVRALDKEIKLPILKEPGCRTHFSEFNLERELDKFDRKIYDIVDEEYNRLVQLRFNEMRNRYNS